MATKSLPRNPSVLIIEPDDAIRRLIAIALEHAGFRTWSAADERAAIASGNEIDRAVIVRDVTLGRSESADALEDAWATLDLCRRTIVTTTAPAHVTRAIGAGRVFAILGKPFEIDELVDVVRRCANASRTRGVRGRKRVETDPESPMKMESVHRFVESVPGLRRVLSLPVTCETEAALHAEMRRTIGELSATLDYAARMEKSRSRLAVFRAASKAAAGLAITAYSAELPISGSRREH
jgi:CheY-like chemotaxis protein